MANNTPRHINNSRLNQVEYQMGFSYLESLPRHMTIVLGNGCNIDCPHCYQEKNGDNLLRNKEIGKILRREFLQLYPQLETLRIQGGEVFALKGFKDLIHDVTYMTNRPLISISTNGTLIDDAWCNRIVEIPFQSITFSFDAGTKTTFEKMRRGANYETVVNNVRRLQTLKKTKKSWYPVIDAFYVIMRSNFREVQEFLDLMLELEIYEVSFQTLLVDDRNLLREPDLLDEQLQDSVEIIELHEILNHALRNYREKFDSISFCGIKNLFDKIGLPSDFLNEESSSLYPVQAKTQVSHNSIARPATPHYELSTPPSCFNKGVADKQCPNPWTTLFITENGDVSLCFLSDPVGNLYETPLVEIWNCPAAIAKRSRMLTGKYTKSGCSKLWCEWRDGKVASTVEGENWHDLLEYFRLLTSQLKLDNSDENPELDKSMGAVRRLLLNRNRRIKELEANLKLLWHDNGNLHNFGQDYIYTLEQRIQNMEQKLVFLSLYRKVKQWLGHALSRP